MVDVMTTDATALYTTEDVMHRIAGVLRCARWLPKDEAELQVYAADLLRMAAPPGYRVEREVDLSDENTIRCGRADILVEDQASQFASGIVVELKVAGSRAATLRQAQRYMRSPRVTALVVASTRAQAVTPWPGKLDGKPTVAVALRGWP